MKAYKRLEKECIKIEKKYNVILFVHHSLHDSAYLVLTNPTISEEEKECIWELYHDWLYIEYKEI